MLKYLKNSEISARLGLNPFNWVWIPSVAYQKPSPLYPKRKTFAIAWLGLQFFLDLDDGTADFTAMSKLFEREPDIKEEND